MSEKDYMLLADNASFASALDRLRGFSLLALDLEMENNYHHYGLHVALIQLSTPDGANFVVDPLAGMDLTPLGNLLVDPGVELILHDSDFDRRTCWEKLGWRLTNLFDTKVAARLCGIRQFGLGSLLNSFFGVVTNKRFQRFDWLRRPLREDALEYAVSDTRYLFKLREVLLEKLEALGRAEWLREECARQEQDVERHKSATDLHLRIKGSAKLTGRQLAVLAATARFRDNLAKFLNRPPMFVISDRRLMEWAVAPPASLKAIRETSGLPRMLYRTKQASALLRAIHDGMRAPEEQHPKRQRPAIRSVRDHEQRLKAMQKWRAEKAAPLDLEPCLLLPNDVLAWRARRPDSPFPGDVAAQIRNWQRNLLLNDFEAEFSNEPVAQQAGSALRENRMNDDDIRLPPDFAENTPS